MMDVKMLKAAWFAGEHNAITFVDPPHLVIELPDGEILVIGDGDTIHFASRSDLVSEVETDDPESVFVAALHVLDMVTGATG